MSESLVENEKKRDCRNVLVSTMKWFNTISQIVLMVILIYALLLLLPDINGSADHTDLEVRASVDGIPQIKPGSSYLLEYYLENTGEVNERYLITTDPQYSWETELMSIEKQNGGAINFEDHENGHLTSDILAPGEICDIMILLNTPYFGTTPEEMEIEYLERNGLLAGTQSRISMRARTYSDNFATGDEAQYLLEVKLIHEVQMVMEKEITIDPWGSREYDLEANITHLSNSPHEYSGEANIYINITFPGQGWIIECPENNFTLFPRISKTMTIHISLPDELIFLPDPYYVTIVFAGENSLSTTIRTSSVRVWLKQMGSVDVYPGTTGDMIVIPGETTLINFTIKNTGNGPDSFMLQLSGESMPWLILAVDTTETLRPAESINISIPVHIPVEDPPREGERRKITFIARSVESPDYIDSTVSYIVIGPFHWIQFQEDKEIEIFPPSTGQAELIILNRGNIRESMTITVGNTVTLNGIEMSLSETNWGITLGTSYFSLDPGQDENIRIEVTAGGNVKSIDIINFTINGIIGGTVNTSSIISVKVGNTHGVIIGSDFTVLNGKLGETVDHIFMVTNTGTTTDIYYLTATVSRQWSQKLDIHQVTLQPHFSSIVRVSITIPMDSPEGSSCDLTLSVSNTFISESLTVTTITSKTRIMNISLVNITYHVYPENTKEIALNIKNSGNVQDTIIIDAFTSTNWHVVVIPGSVTIDPFSSLQTTIRLTAPSQTSTYEIITILVKAHSESDDSITASAYLHAMISMVKALVTEGDPYLFYDHSDYSGILEGYATRGSSIEYNFMIRNIDQSEQHITIEHSPSKLSLSISPSALLVDPGKEGTFTVTVSVPETAVTGDSENLIYISSSGGKYETIKLISHVITKDLGISDISLNRVMEGKTTEVKVRITHTGSGFSNIGNSDLLICRDVVLLLEYKDDSIIRTISLLDIGSTTTVTFRITMDHLKWYQKEKDVTISVKIISYDSVVNGDDNPNNNRMEKRMNVHDSPPSGLFTSSGLTGFVFSLLLLGITVQHYRGSMSSMARSEFSRYHTQEHYLRALTTGLVLGIIYTFPVGNFIGECILSIGIILGFALTIHSGLESAKRRIGIGVPLLYFVPMVCIMTIGTGVPMMIESIFNLTTPVRIYQMIIGILIGIALYMRDQYTNVDFGEFPTQIIWPVFSVVIAGFLAYLFNIIGGLPGIIFILIFFIICLGFFLNSLPLLKSITISHTLHFISLILGVFTFFTFLYGFEISAFLFLVGPIPIQNGLILLLILGCGLLSYKAGFIFRVRTGHRIENLLAVMINISEGKKISDNPFEEFNYYHVSEIFREGNDFET